jgi:hypothetical protein
MSDINSNYRNDIDDIKEGLFKLIEVMSNANNNIKVMSENQSLLNDKLNQLLKDEKLDKDFSEVSLS